MPSLALNIDLKWRLRRTVLCTVRGKHTEKEKEEDLKAYLLQNVEDHLWKDFLFWISDLGWEAATKLNTNFDALPQWPNLAHFKVVMSVDFNDGSHHEDISKLVLFTAQNILLESQSKLGYLLLHCIHYYIELDMHTLFEVHTEETITAGRATLNKFSELMEEYITKSQPETNKNWSFPKKHMITHIFNDILAKGAASSMHTELDELDNYSRKASNDPETNEPLDIEPVVHPVVHMHLGLKQGKHSFPNIMCTHGTNRAFTDFQTKLNGFLNVFLPQNGIPLPDGPGRALHLRAEDEIIEFQFLQMNYESMVDWHLHQDLLWCSPKFYGSLSCSIGDTDFSLALIHPYNVGIGVHQRRDVDLGLCRLFEGLHLPEIQKWMEIIWLYIL
ncbi:uncharacterized protein EDB93DRAFT_1105900 [Suillus bovinus]|uniref:uncharacterized protein n=1 Tax=Suillus bovinus TaxID=48563 RepID=UPI001B87533F|nr:uncharacterized protein EDB93DRAFT_1105900 [Suillus bovinus]KAG2140495.1 hypothetical protein EDB93DRAFT_1105900 [Suillus bovinus]